jgi:hypothetical protein
MPVMPDLTTLSMALLAAANSIDDLLPFLVVMIVGFLVGAWGQASRSTIAVIAGMLLILIAVGGFLADNGDGPIPDVLK